MTVDWRPMIVELIGIQRRIFELDTEGIWEFHYPRVAAPEQSLLEAERARAMRFDAAHRNFLTFADGWPSVYQSVDLFGCDDLAGGPRFDVACSMLEATDPEVRATAMGSATGLLPIAATMVDLDLFVMPVVDGNVGPTVVWLAGSEVDRFESFDEFFATLIRFNREELAALGGDADRGEPGDRAQR